jgi:BCD family chlorophyll transporter-like MFS transporter
MSRPPFHAWVHQLSSSMLPFADAASDTLPLGRLLRLSLFQVSVGMATVLLMGTLNRVMIVELAIPASLVALMAALPVLLAPLRALLGFRSDSYRSAIGWKRSPYLWFGSLFQMGGLATMPFALLLLSGDTTGPYWMGVVGAGIAFLMTGLGLHTTQTAGLALATDLAREEDRPRVVALLFVMLLAGMGLSAAVFGLLLADFSQLRLIQTVQGAAVVTVFLNLIALWRQEGLAPMSRAQREAPRPRFREAWAAYAAQPQAIRLLVVVGLGACAFSMQDILLEPYGGEVLGLSVSATTALTALWAGGALAGFALAARRLARGANPHRLAGLAALIGIAAFSAVIFAQPLGSATLFRVGAVFIGLGSGLFGVCTLHSAMTLTRGADSGLALGAWGAAQAGAAGLGILLGGGIRDIAGAMAARGALGPGLADPAVGYAVVYHIEIALLFAALIAIGPLVRTADSRPADRDAKFGLADFPAA